MDLTISYLLIDPIAFADLEDKLLNTKRSIAAAITGVIHHYVYEAEKKDPSFVQGDERWDGEMGEFEAWEILFKTVPGDVGITFTTNIQQWFVSFEPTSAVLALSHDSFYVKAVEVVLSMQGKASIKSVMRCQMP